MLSKLNLNKMERMSDIIANNKSKIIMKILGTLNFHILFSIVG
jgi:hypothetical protein